MSKKQNKKVQQIKQAKARKRNRSNKKNQGAKAQALQERRDKAIALKKEFERQLIEKFNKEFEERHKNG